MEMTTNHPAHTGIRLVTGNVGDGLVQPVGGLLDHAKTAVLEPCRNVFGCLSYQRNFEIVDRACAVERKCGNDLAPHQLDQYWIKPTLDHVRTHGPDDRAAGVASGDYSVNNRIEVQPRVYLR